MKVSLLQEGFTEALSVVGRSVSTKATLPVLGNILLETGDKKLRISATNLETGINM